MVDKEDTPTSPAPAEGIIFDTSHPDDAAATLRVWMCGACVASVEDSLDRQRSVRRLRKRLMREFRAAVLIQRNVRMWSEAQRYQVLRRGLRHIQGRYRGQKARRVFKQVFSSMYRPFSVLILGAEFDASLTTLAGGSAQEARNTEVQAVVCFLTRPFGDVHLLQRRRGLIFDEEDNPPAQFFRVQTDWARVEAARSRAVERVTASVRWASDSPRSVLCATSLCQAVVTLTLAPKNLGDQESGASEFLGQAVVDLHEMLLHSRGQTMRVPLGRLAAEPLDQKTLKPMRLQGLHTSVPGAVTLQIEPFSNTTTQCGFLNEISAIVSRSKPKKKWWAVLAEGVLRLLLRPGDWKPRMEVPLRNASVKLRKGGVVELRFGGESPLLLCSEKPEDRRKWFRKMQESSRL